MNKSKVVSPLVFWAYAILLIASLALLVIGLAPIGLLLIARSMGLDLTHAVGDNGIAFIVFGLIILGILAIPKYPGGTKIGIWVVCVLAILNMGGCLSLNGLRNISAINSAEQVAASDR